MHPDTTKSVLSFKKIPVTIFAEELEPPRVSAQNKMPTRHLLFIDMDGRQQIAPIAENAYILTADQIVQAMWRGEMPDINLPLLIAAAIIRLTKLEYHAQNEAIAR